MLFHVEHIYIFLYQKHLLDLIVSRGTIVQLLLGVLHRVLFAPNLRNKFKIIILVDQRYRVNSKKKMFQEEYDVIVVGAGTLDLKQQQLRQI
jgi:hypothetical protein